MTEFFELRPGDSIKFYRNNIETSAKCSTYPYVGKEGKVDCWMVGIHLPDNENAEIPICDIYSISSYALCRDIPLLPTSLQVMAMMICGRLSPDELRQLSMSIFQDFRNMQRKEDLPFYEKCKGLWNESGGMPVDIRAVVRRCCSVMMDEAGRLKEENPQLTWDDLSS